MSKKRLAELTDLPGSGHGPCWYVDLEGFTIRHGEKGQLSPNGNSMFGAWVLRDPNGAYLDHHQYRHDLMERAGYQAGSYMTLKEYLDASLGVAA